MTSSNTPALTVELSYLNPESIRWMHKRTKFNVASTSHVQQTVALALRDIFEGLDLDGSGSINIQDFREAVNYVAEVSDLSFDAESLADFFESMDQDFSGTIDMKEFISGMISHPDSDEIIRTIQSLQVTFSSFANQLRRQKLYNHINVIDKLSVTAFSPKKTKSFFKTLNNNDNNTNYGNGNSSINGHSVSPTSNTVNTQNTKQNKYKSKLRNSNSNNDVSTMDKNFETNKLKDFLKIFSVEHFKDKNEYEESTVERIESKYKKDVNNAEHLRQKRIERERAHDAAVYFEGGPKVSYRKVPDKNKNSTANTDKNRNFQDLMDLVGDDSMLTENNTELNSVDNSTNNVIGTSGGNSGGSSNTMLIAKSSSNDSITSVNKPNHIANNIHNISNRVRLTPVYTNQNGINSGNNSGNNSNSNSTHSTPKHMKNSVSLPALPSSLPTSPVHAMQHNNTSNVSQNERLLSRLNIAPINTNTNNISNTINSNGISSNTNRKGAVMSQTPTNLILRSMLSPTAGGNNNISANNTPTYNDLSQNKFINKSSSGSGNNSVANSVHSTPKHSTSHTPSAKQSK